ncbi:MAG: hypothetical protein A2X84_10065 [Desulfuromonadaceae bacterium GWC2_58_13]|nr:MAG: hypothetical protein A2X84_10065 [Desulfuromonadaceae bacterium GWC2_58_13]
MLFFFPDHAKGSDLEQYYLSLSPVERLMVLREFIGVTYVRRFQFFAPLASFPSSFRRNLNIAAGRQDKRFRINDRLWAQPELTRSYLRLIFRHYLLGFVVQMTRKHCRDALPANCPSCYPEAPAILAALIWYNRRFALLETEIDRLIDFCFERNLNHLYLNCLLAYRTAAALFGTPEMLESIDQVKTCRLGGTTPLGAELEFSNLGKDAGYERSFGRHQRDPRFHNFIHYHKFFLADVSWRLGGYLDHQIRLRRHRSAPWVGGYLEYSLVRLDYLRKFSMPLSTDPGFLARYLEEVIAFSRDIDPHSLHLNLEDPRAGNERPTLEDYLCLLLLGGDLRLSDDGVLREHRFANNELRGIVQQRKHLSPYDNHEHLVTEFSFLRLWRKGERNYGYLPVIMAIKGFQWAYDIRSYCREPAGDMLLWAHRPQPLPDAAISRFLQQVESGLIREGAHARSLISAQMEEVRSILEGYQVQLRHQN